MAAYPVGPAWVGDDRSSESLAPLVPQTPPDGLYVVRSGVATAVTVEQMAKALYATSGQWHRMPAKSQDWFLADAGRVIARLLALTQAQGGAE